MKVLVAALFFVMLMVGPGYAGATAEPAYDRVVASGTVRCGYQLWPQFVERDPNTGAMSGAWYDYIEAVGKTLNLKIEWVAEVSMGEMAVSLNTGKIDAYCLAVAATDTRLAQSYFTTPSFYAAFNIYGRADDGRLASVSDVNNPAIRIIGFDGEETGIVARRKFPAAQMLELSNLASGSDQLMSVVTGKADVALTDPMTANTFNTNNNNALKQIPAPGPVAVFGASIALPMGENRLKEMFDGATRDLLGLGVMSDILTRNGFKAGLDYLPVALPYVISNP